MHMVHVCGRASVIMHNMHAVADLFQTFTSECCSVWCKKSMALPQWAHALCGHYMNGWVHSSAAGVHKTQLSLAN
jgi:hypothetical protein